MDDTTKEISDLALSASIQITLRNQRAELNFRRNTVVKYEGRFYEIQGTMLDRSNEQSYRKTYNAFLKQDFDPARRPFKEIYSLDVYN
jgi:hypothetical protein